MQTGTDAQEQVATVAVRVTERPRDYLERVEKAARAYFAARRIGPWPEVVARREALRRLLNEAEPEVWERTWE